MFVKFNIVSQSNKIKTDLTNKVVVKNYSKNYLAAVLEIIQIEKLFYNFFF